LAGARRLAGLHFGLHPSPGKKPLPAAK